MLSSIAIANLNFAEEAPYIALQLLRVLFVLCCGGSKTYLETEQDMYVVILH